MQHRRPKFSKYSEKSVDRRLAAGHFSSVSDAQLDSLTGAAGDVVIATTLRKLGCI